MHENGELQIVGRYKDMIIRAGENIAPSAIEATIFSRFNLTTEVVGVPDEIAGEVPVAVMRQRAGQEVDPVEIKEMLVKELGAAWVPDYFVDIKDLGLDDYPRGVTGKVQKVKLRKLVIDKEKKSHPATTSGDSNIDVLIRIWTKMLGLGLGTLTPQSSIRDWADSLLIARFSSVLTKETGISLTLKDLLDHPTIEAQANLITSREHRKKTADPAFDFKAVRQGPPDICDMSHIGGDEKLFEETKTGATATLVSIGMHFNIATHYVSY